MKNNSSDQAPQRWLTGLDLGIALVTVLLGLFILLGDLVVFG
jgi:hypothetical protein